MANKPLAKDDISAWRDLAQLEAFENGLRWLESNYCPKPNRLDAVQTQHSDTLVGTGYRQAMQDIRERLTQYEAPAAEDPSLPRLQ